MRHSRFRLAVILAALALSASHAWAQASAPDPRVVDTITADEDTVTLVNLPSGRGSASIVVSNYCSCSLVIEGRVGTIWESVSGAPTIAADGVYSVSAAGLDAIRVRADTYASGTTTIGIRVSSAGGGSGGSGGVGDLTDVETNTSNTATSTATTATNTGTIAGAVSSSRVNVNIAAVNGSTPTTGGIL